MPSALAVSRMLLRISLILNVIFGSVLGIMLVASIALGGIFLAMEGFGEVHPADALRLVVMTASMVAVFRLTHLVLKRLVDIIDTIRAGDPFSEANPGRLRRIAWHVLAIEVLWVLSTYLLRTLTLKVPIEPDVSWNVSGGLLMAVPLILVLSRVFEEGARMRAAIEAPAAQ